MKNIFLLLVSLSLLTFTSCSDDDRGQATPSEQLIMFPVVTNSIFAFDGTEGTEDVVVFGSIKPVSGNHTVNLVFDAESSTMIEGVDFSITKGSAELNDGDIHGEFKIFYYTAEAIEEGKRAVFTIESSTLEVAGFKDSYSARVSFACPIDDFFGTFQANTWWLGSTVHDIVEGDVENQMKVIGFWEDNLTKPDLIINYNPTTFVASITEQDTGYFHATYGANIMARPAIDGGISTINPCARELRLVVNYYIPGVGTFGDQVEVFKGL